jgi:hypothetical protein
LIGDGALADSASDTDIGWRVVTGDPRRTAGGAQTSNDIATAWLVPGEPSGLIHALVTLSEGKGKAGILWRAKDSSNYLSFSISEDGFDLSVIADGDRQTLRSGALGEIDAREPVALQIRDDGNEIDASVNGRPVVQCQAVDGPPAVGLGVGFLLDARGGGAPCIRDFEAHPRLVPLASKLPLAAPWSQSGEIAVISDSFTARRDDLEGYTSPNGVRWSRMMGQCRFALAGDGGVAIVATSDRPAVSRTAYGVDWPDPNFADVSTVIVPPGEGRGKNHMARGGLIFWEDEKNYFIINNWLDDSYNGTSISAFFYVRGFEDIYDAVWTNVNDRLVHGQPNRLRVVCDGRQFRVYLNGAPVLYRAFRDIYPAFRRLHIRKVGIVANWEWGHDTGSRFLSFEALAGVAGGGTPDVTDDR